MKATKAYIASFGTTGVLLAASILMLAVVSAVVAFDRWPGGTGSTRVQTLVLSDDAAPIRVSSQSSAPSATPSARALARAVAAPRLSAGTRAQLVAGERLSGGNRDTAAIPALPNVPVP